MYYRDGIKMTETRLGHRHAIYINVPTRLC